MPDSVRSRYLVTLGTQVFRLLLSVLSAAVVPRTLGPAIYGNYSFLLSTAAALRGVLDNSTQQAFFTFSSQERASGPLTKLYALVLGGQLLIVLAIIGAAAAAGKTEWLWHAQKVDQIVWVTILDWFLFLALSLQQLGDSKGLTVKLQLIGAGVSVLPLLGLLILWATATLNFYTFTGLNLLSAVLSSGMLGYWLVVRNRATFWQGALAVRTYVQRWWRFAKPLLLLQYYLPVVAYLGVYLIQRWYGSAEQGYYALALQWSAFAMVFTNAAVWIFWREIAHHSASGDLRLAALTYEKFSRLFVFLVLVLSCWLSAGSGLLVQIVAGDRYLAASRVLAIMAFYPVAQTLGQLTTASLKATDRTASYARWSVLLSIPDLLLTYVLLAPTTALVPGLHLGAVGMASKMALFGIVSVQVYDWTCCRHLGLSYVATLRRNIAAMATVGAIAFVILIWGSSWLLRAGLQNVKALGISSCAYGIAILTIIWLRPGLAGLTRGQVLRGVQLLGRC